MTSPNEILVDAPGAPIIAPPPESVWSAIGEALRGSRRDYTQGPIGRAIFILAVPMVLEMVMESVFAVCDVFFVSRLGADAIATVGLTESLLVIIYAMAMGLAIGASATVARRVGERDGDGAGRAAVQGLALALGVSLSLGIAGALLGPRWLAMMGASSQVIATGAAYSRVMLGGCVSIVCLFVGNAIFRGAGDATVSMRALWLANGINIALAPCLIFGVGPFPRLGVTGAAVATTFARGVGTVYVLAQLARGGRHVRVVRQHLRIELTTMRTMLRVSSSGALQAFIGSANWIGLIRIVSSFGANAVAGYTIGVRVIMFALLPAWGLGNAAATMVGQALGAKLPDRAERAVWKTALYNVCFLGGVGAVIVAVAPSIARVFTIDADVLRYATSTLRVVAAGFVFFAYGMVLTQAFNGAGDTRTPTLLNLVAFWLMELPLAWLLAVHVRLGPAGALGAVPISFAFFAAASAWLFRRGGWKTKRI